MHIYRNDWPITIVFGYWLSENSVIINEQLKILYFFKNRKFYMKNSFINLLTSIKMFVF